jgi:hypothetical protein
MSNPTAYQQKKEELHTPPKTKKTEEKSEQQ